MRILSEIQNDENTHSCLLIASSRLNKQSHYVSTALKPSQQIRLLPIETSILSVHLPIYWFIIIIVVVVDVVVVIILFCCPGLKVVFQRVFVDLKQEESAVH